MSAGLRTAFQQKTVQAVLCKISIFKSKRHKPKSGKKYRNNVKTYLTINL